MKNNAFTNLICTHIKNLHYNYPQLPLGEHFFLALDGKDIYGVSDKEFEEALYKYLSNLDKNAE